jgi:hypothetical protein
VRGLGLGSFRSAAEALLIEGVQVPAREPPSLHLSPLIEASPAYCSTSLSEKQDVVNHHA